MAVWQYAIVSVEDAAIEVGASEADMLRVERLVNSASRAIESFCRTWFKKRDDVTVFVSGSGWEIIDLGAPVISVTTVHWDDKADGTYSTLVAASEYKLLKERGQLYNPASWWGTDVENYKVVGDFGYDPVPHDVVEACLSLVKAWWQGYQGGGVGVSGGLRSEDIGEYSYERFGPSSGQAGELSPIPADVQGMLQAYRRYV